MRHYITILLLFCAYGSFAQSRISFDDMPQYDPNPNYKVTRRIIYNIKIEPNGDTLYTATLPGVTVRPKTARVNIDTRRHARLIHNLKVVYPIALYANKKFREIERELETIPDKREQARFVKQVEKDLKAAYTPVLKKMTRSQGLILIKLIDRQTGASSYELVKQLRGGFTAFFWQNIARMFGADLKQKYDPAGEDALLESLVQMLEAGLI